MAFDLLNGLVSYAWKVALVGDLPELLNGIEKI
jgi:hypothetical protein